MTESVQATPAPSAAPDGGSLLSALESLPNEAPEEQAELAPEAEAPEAEAETAPEPAPSADTDEAIFSPASLATPEGIAKAQARLQEKKRAAGETYLKLKKHEASISKREAKLKIASENFKQDVQFVQNVRQDVKALFEGDANTTLAALGRLTGKDPVKALEELNLNLLHNGKRQTSPEVEEIRAELRALKEEQARKAEEAAERIKAEEQTGYIQTRYQEIHALGSDAEKYPNLAAEFAHDADETLKIVVARIVEENSDPDAPPVVDSQVLAMLEEELKAFVQRRSGTATRDAEQGQVTRNPGTPARTPGKSITPSVATQRGAATRELTEAEHMQQLVNDSSFWNQLGL